MKEDKNWLDIQLYFEHLPGGIWDELFMDAPYPWSPLESLSETIARFFQRFSSSCHTGTGWKLKGMEVSEEERGLTIEETCKLKEDFIDPDLQIFIGKGTLLEPGAMIKPGTVILEDCEIRQAAYMRGNTLIADHCVVGHTTEVKNAIFLEHTEAGHFAYIGDSILGAYTNIGAGTKLSNLQFRTMKDKKKMALPPIPFSYKGEKLDINISKLGAIIGEGGETGCNAVLSPFVILGKECWIVPCLCVPKGIFPRRSILKTFQDCKDKMI